MVSFRVTCESTVIYTITRLLPAAALLALWAWLTDGSAADPANLFLLLALVAAAIALASIRRYWHIRKTSRSRRHSTLIP
jgi:hypothetical protein